MQTIANIKKCKLYIHKHTERITCHLTKHCNIVLMLEFKEKIKVACLINGVNVICKNGTRFFLDTKVYLEPQKVTSSF